MVGPELIGGTYGWGNATVCILAAGACLCAAWESRSETRRLHLGPVVGFAVVALVWTCFQALPLPRGMTEVLQPDAVRLSDDASRLLGDDPRRWLPLSLSPGNTHAEVVRHLGILATIIATVLLVRKGGRRKAFVAVAASVATMVVVTAVHFAAGMDDVFGVFEPRWREGQLIAPLLNDNHLSGFFAMGVPLFVALGIDENDDLRKRLGWFVAALGATVGCLASSSRGGTVSLLVGVAVLGALALRKKRRDGGLTDLRRVALLGVTTVIGAAVCVYAGWEPIERYFTSGGNKLVIAADGLGLAMDHPFVGVGRGGFSAAFAYYLIGYTRATYPENLIVQWVTEWGLIVAPALLLLLMGLFIRAVRTARSWSHLGGLAALTSIVVHDMVDFSLEYAGISVVGAVLLGAAIGQRSSKKETSRRPKLSSVGLGVGIAALAVGVVAAPLLDSRSVTGLRTDLERLAQLEDRTAFWDRVETAVRIHPAEPIFTMIGGAEAARTGDPRALAWLNRVMHLAPEWSAPHEEAARFLFGRGRISQGFIELKESARRGNPRSQIICSALAQRPDATKDLIHIMGTDPAGLDLLERVRSCLSPELPDARRAVDAHLLANGSLEARARMVEAALSVGNRVYADELLAPVRDDRSPSIARALSQRHAAAGEHTRAAQILGEAIAVASDPEVARLIGSRARAQAAAGDAVGMRASMDQLRRAGSGLATDRARIWLIQGQLEARMASDREATEAYRRAHDLDPASDGLLRLATHARTLGHDRQARRAYAELCRLRGPDDPGCRAGESLRRSPQLAPAP